MRGISKFFVAAIFAMGIIGSASAIAQQRIVVDGNMWLNSSPETRKVFLVGVGNMVAMEAAYAKKKNMPPPIVGTMAAKAVDGMTLDQVSDRITRWYEANPTRKGEPVMGVIWVDLIAPSGARK